MSEKELNVCLLWRPRTVNSSFLNINHDITDGTSERQGLVLILLNEKLAGIHVGFDLTFFFKHSKWEAKNLFHLGAIKWIPESLAPARRRSSFFFSFFFPLLVLLPISSPSRQQKECSLFSLKATFPTPSHRDHHD